MKFLFVLLFGFAVCWSCCHAGPLRSVEEGDTPAAGRKMRMLKLEENERRRDYEDGTGVQDGEGDDTKKEDPNATSSAESETSTTVEEVATAAEEVAIAAEETVPSMEDTPSSTAEHSNTTTDASTSDTPAEPGMTATPVSPNPDPDVQKQIDGIIDFINQTPSAVETQEIAKEIAKEIEAHQQEIAAANPEAANEEKEAIANIAQELFQIADQQLAEKEKDPAGWAAKTAAFTEAVDPKDFVRRTAEPGARASAPSDPPTAEEVTTEAATEAATEEFTVGATPDWWVATTNAATTVEPSSPTSETVAEEATAPVVQPTNGQEGGEKALGGSH